MGMDESDEKKFKEKGKPKTQTYIIANQIYPRNSPNKKSTYKYITFTYSTRDILPAPC